MAGLVLILFGLVMATQRKMKSILYRIPVLVFCIVCSNWQVFANSPGNCDVLMITGNNDIFHEGFANLKIFMEDPPDLQMFSSSHIRIFSPGRRFECNIHLPDFNRIPKRYYFPYRAIPPPVC